MISSEKPSTNNINKDKLLEILDEFNICSFLFFTKEQTIKFSEKTSKKYCLKKCYKNTTEEFQKLFSNSPTRILFLDILPFLEKNKNIFSKEYNQRNENLLMASLFVTEMDSNNKPEVILGILDNAPDSEGISRIYQHVKEYVEKDTTVEEKSDILLKDILTSIGKLFFALYYFDISKNYFLCLQNKVTKVLSHIGFKGDYTIAWNKYIQYSVVPEDREAMTKFSDITTLQERLANTDHLVGIYRRIDYGWSKGEIIVAKRDENGNAIDLIYVVSDINEEKEKEFLQEKNAYEVQHDPLTGIYNRKGFEESIKLELYKKIPTGFALIDIDGFKIINDTYGHTIGDKILIQVVETISSELGPQDRIFRFGGDEFGVLFHNIDFNTFEEICNKIQRIHAKLKDNILVYLPITLSTGVCFSEHGYEEKMYLMADRALYYTKTNGRSGVTQVNLHAKIINRWKDPNSSVRPNNALIRSNTGIFRLEFSLDESEAPKLICNEMTKSILGVSNNTNPEKCYEAWIHGLNPIQLEKLKQIRTSLVNSKHLESTYDWNHPKWGTIKVRSGGSGEIMDGKQVIFGYHHSLQNIEIIEDENDTRILLDSLCSIYFCAYYINLLDNSFYNFKSTKSTQKLELQRGNAKHAMRVFIDNLVKKEYQDKMREFCMLDTLPERLNDDTHIDCEYISTTQRGWCRASFLPVKRNEEGKITHVLLGITSIDALKKQQIELEKERKLRVELQQSASDLVMKAKIIVISLISKKTGVISYWYSGQNFTKKKTANYKDLLAHDSHYVDPIEQSDFIEKLSLNVIKKNVEEYGSYLYTVNMLDNKENQKLFEFHFEEYKNDPSFIFGVIEDITSRDAYDAITNSLNMKGFNYQANFYLHTNNNEEKFAILAFDIRNFKAMNNQYGYEGGDKILKEVFLFLKNSKLHPWVTTRETADTFFCLVSQSNINEEILIDMCNCTLYLDQNKVSFKMDCGIFLIEDSSENITDMCDKARVALVASNHQVLNPFVIYTEELKQQYLEQAYIVSNFREALKQNQFAVLYQPIYDVNTKRMASAEALIRWIPSKGSLISAGTFLPVLEKNGAISELDEFVYHNATELLKSRIRHCKKCIPIAINLSRYDLYQPALIEKIIAFLEENPTLCELIRFEITESGFVDITEEAKGFIQKLRDLGCKILIDDFGTGYSSLSTLSECLCDYVKLDMSFTKNIGKNKKTEIIIISTIDIVHKMGMEIIVEGVETKEQFEFLKENHCDYIQGFYFAKPMYSDEFAKEIK